MQTKEELLNQLLPKEQMIDSVAGGRLRSWPFSVHYRDPAYCPSLHLR